MEKEVMYKGVMLLIMILVWGITNYAWYKKYCCFVRPSIFWGLVAVMISTSILAAWYLYFYGIAYRADMYLVASATLILNSIIPAFLRKAGNTSSKQQVKPNNNQDAL